MKEKKEKTIEEILVEGTLIDKALQQAGKEALLRHKQAGNPVAVWRDGKVILIPPEDI